MATGKSLGPIKTSATTPISASSDHAKSNMAGVVAWFGVERKRPAPLAGGLAYL
jgi:hypothetical protein